jgi:hypothetical protein
MAAVKLRLWAKEPVAAPRVLSPTRADLNYLKQFLDERANDGNRRIGIRLAELLTTIHSTSPSLFERQDMAHHISTRFQQSLNVAGAVGVVSPE